MWENTQFHPWSPVSKHTNLSKCIHLFILFWPSRVFAAACSLATASRGYSLVAVPGFLAAMASLVEEPRLQGVRASVVVAHRLSCPVARGIFLDQGSHVLCTGRWILNHQINQGSPTCRLYYLDTQVHNSFSEILWARCAWNSELIGIYKDNMVPTLYII